MSFHYKHRVYFPKLTFLLIITWVFVSCNVGKQKENVETFRTKLENIQESGVLKVAVDNNSTDYFVYRGKPMGFKYDLLQELAKDLGIKPEFIVCENLYESFDGLINDEFDLIAKNLTITKRLGKKIDFTIPIAQTNQVLVQRLIQPEKSDSGFVYSTLELAGKKVFVQKESHYQQRLMNLSKEIGGQIEVVEDSVLDAEKLIELVAKGEIDYTVCDEHVARINKTYYSNLDVSLKVSFPQNIAWAVKIESEGWEEYINNWISEFKKTNKYKYLYHKYFVSQWSAYRLKSGFHSINGGNLSVYDTIVKRFSNKYNWDWRLISSIIYQESRFNHRADSWVGAYGLMQIMPNTAKSLGVKNYKDPKQNIEGGILMLNWLNKRFSETIPDSAQRIRFVLASYNIGLGHVLDAQRLADKYGKDRHTWDDNVDYFLLNKSKKKFYKDSVVHYGYCQGEQAYNYVNKIITNYNHYLNVFSE